MRTPELKGFRGPWPNFSSNTEERTERSLYPVGAGRYCLLARESLDYGFDVPGLQIQLQPLRVPTIIRFGFSVDYDNIPNLRVRHTRRILDCRVRGLWSGDYDWDVNIVEQVEC